MAPASLAARPGRKFCANVLLSGSVAHLGPAAEAILFAAARIDHIDKTIEPALAAGTFVVSDRFADSTRAYQGTCGQLDPRFLRALERISLHNIRPDLTVILDLPRPKGSHGRQPGVALEKLPIASSARIWPFMRACATPIFR